MKLSLLSWKVSHNDIIKSMTSTMLIKFKKYWNVIDNVTSVAIVLDPRYKLKLINFLFPKLYGEKTRIEIMEKSCVMKYQILCYFGLEEYGFCFPY